MKFLKKFGKFVLLLAYCGVVTGQGSHWHSQSWPLPSEAYSEGECISPQTVNVDVNWIIQQRTFYIPIASQFALHRYSDTLLSRPTNSDTEMNSMCLTVEASQSGAALNMTNVGYDDREFRQSCTPGSQPGKINCFAAGSSAGVNPTKTRATENFIVAWDARSYMIIVRCVDGFFRDFSVFSTRPSVSHDVLNSVLNVTRNLGFDERRIQTMSYDTCLRTSGGVNSSNFNLNNQRITGPFTNSVLSAPFANAPRTAPVQQVQQQGYNQQGFNPGLNQQFPQQFPQSQPTGPGPVNPSQIPFFPQGQNGQFGGFNFNQGPGGGGPGFPFFEPNGGYQGGPGQFR